MRVVDLRIQGSWLRRRGIRGGWVTACLHQYCGRESTERLHSHPWALAIGVVLKGRLVEVIAGCQIPRKRGFLSIGTYRRSTRHSVVEGEAVTLFIGLLRTRQRIEGAAEVPTREGYCHYTEIMPDEPGFRGDFVEAGGT